MFHALIWSLTFILLALWSVAAWAFHSVAVWTISNAGTLTAGSATVDSLRAPDWLAPWVPPELALAFTSMLSAAGPAVEAMLGQAPALAGVLSVAVWAVWGIGSVLIVILGIVCSGVITLLRRRKSMFAAPSMGLAAAD